MFDDDTRLVAYDWNYMSAGGYPVSMICVYGIEREGTTAETLLMNANEHHPNDNCQIITFAEFERIDRERTLAIGVHEVDEETFNEMLNVLPPLKWCDRISEKRNARVNEFCMSEFDHSVFTQQYGRAFIDGKTRYYSATVDYFDESTWIHNRL